MVPLTDIPGLNLDRMVRWNDRLTEHDAVATMAIGISHNPKNVGQLVLCVPQMAEMDKHNLIIILRGAIQQLLEEQQ